MLLPIHMALDIRDLYVAMAHSADELIHALEHLEHEFPWRH